MQEDKPEILLGRVLDSREHMHCNWPIDLIASLMMIFAVLQNRLRNLSYNARRGILQMFEINGSNSITDKFHGLSNITALFECNVIFLASFPKRKLINIHSWAIDCCLRSIDLENWTSHTVSQI